MISISSRIESFKPRMQEGTPGMPMINWRGLTKIAVLDTGCDVSAGYLKRFNHVSDSHKMQPGIVEWKDFVAGTRLAWTKRTRSTDLRWAYLILESYREPGQAVHRSGANHGLCERSRTR